MAGISTVALIERRPDISRDLFSRYWRDVHGVMAARIPGFATYTQYHVTPLTGGYPAFEGVAIVTFASEGDRDGLANSEVTQHIHRDEQNVFARALLYNLDAVSRRQQGNGDRRSASAGFVVLTADDAAAAICSNLAESGATFTDLYDLRSGDPSGWNNTDASEAAATTVIHAGWTSADGAASGLAGLNPELPRYRVDEVYVMVDGGVPTAVGLRGLDAVRTINEANAENQLSPAVVRAIYGPGMAAD